MKRAATWLARAVRIGSPVGGFVNALELMSWLDTDRPFIDSYLDPPKTWEELRQGAQTPRRGYERHHVVEQTPAENDGFPRSMIDSPENLVEIPTLKHWRITAWYQTKNKNYGGLSPREYLRGSDWDERVRVGLEALIEHEVLKP